MGRKKTGSVNFSVRFTDEEIEQLEDLRRAYQYKDRNTVIRRLLSNSGVWLAMRKELIEKIRLDIERFKIAKEELKFS